MAMWQRTIGLLGAANMQMSLCRLGSGSVVWLLLKLWFELGLPSFLPAFLPVRTCSQVYFFSLLSSCTLISDAHVWLCFYHPVPLGFVWICAYNYIHNIQKHYFTPTTTKNNKTTDPMGPTTCLERYRVLKKTTTSIWRSTIAAPLCTPQLKVEVHDNGRRVHPVCPTLNWGAGGREQLHKSIYVWVVVFFWKNRYVHPWCLFFIFIFLGGVFSRF